MGLQQEEEISVKKAELEKKQSQAVERKQQLEEETSTKLRSKQEKVAASKLQQEEEIHAKKAELEKKQLEATERKHQLEEEMSVKLRSKQEKVASSKLQQEEEISVKKAELEKKQSQAEERKAKILQSIITKNDVQIDHLSTTSSITTTSNSSIKPKMTQERLDQKLSLANERKKQHLENITNKLHVKMEKVSSARSIVNQQHEEEKKAIEERTTQ